MENQLKAELRIGNALKFWNNIFFVSEITELKITAKNKSLGIICEDYIEFSPITLTEDILLRLGFDEENNELFDDYFDFTKGKLAIYYDSIKNRFIYLGTSIQIKYVHQLQNLYFALCDEELTFKN